MVLVQNNSERDLTIVFMGVQYTLPVSEPVEIPEPAAKLYFAYNIEKGPDYPAIVQACCDRLRRNNPELGQLPDKEIWDSVIRKVYFGTEITKGKKKERKP